MKKAGFLVIVILVVAIVGFSSATYAFYSAARAEFTFVVGSEVGSSIGLNLVNKSNNLSPANTAAGVNTYTPVSGNVGEEYAVFVVQYNVSSTISVNFFIDGVSYKDSLGQSFSAADDLYLDSILAYDIKLETSLTTYHIADGETYLTTNLHTINDSEWKAKYDNTDSTTRTATSFNFPTVQQGSGYLFCYVRFYDVGASAPVTQELVPPAFDGMTISFTIATDNA